MPVLVVCPACQLEGQLPDDAEGGLVSCPRCARQFPPQPPAQTVALQSGGGDGMSVWVGAEPSPVHTPPPRRNLLPDELSRSIPLSERPTRPPVEITKDNAAEHVDWVQEEVERFNRFVTQQLELIARTRAEIAGNDSQATAVLMTREQDLNREKAATKGRASALDRREADLAEHWLKYDKRLAEVERLEAAAQRKLEEINEMEDAIRSELEAREQEFEGQRRAIEEEVGELRTRVSESVAAPETDLLASWHCG